MSKYISYKKAKKIKLSDNFTLDEFLYSDQALRFNIKNKFPTEYLPRIQFLVKTVLQPLRDKFGAIKITSGYRSVALCIKVGSNKRSNHARGLAADIKFYDKTVDMLEVMKYIDDNLEFKELIAEYFPHGWIHVAASATNNKRNVKLKDRKHDYTRMSVDSIIKLYKKKRV